MFPQLVSVPWSQCHQPITAGIFSIGAANRGGIWKQEHSGTDLFQQGSSSDHMDDPCHAPPRVHLTWLLDTSCPACLGHHTCSWVEMGGRQREREREAAAVPVLPAVWRMASVPGSSHLWEFPGCKLALAGRAQQGSCRGFSWAGQG